MKITKLALNDILYELASDITIDNTLTTNQDSVPSTALVKTNIDRIDNNVSEVNTQLSTIQSNLSSLQTSVSELNAKVVKNTGNAYYVSQTGLAVVELNDVEGNIIYFQIRENGTFGLLTYNN